MSATVLLALGLYATTNIDNLVVLTAFSADRSYRTGQVVAGAYLGLVAIVAVSAGGAAAAASVPRHTIGLLGVIPLTLGTIRLASLVRGTRPTVPDTAPTGGHHRPFVVAGVTIGSGSDNVAAYVPVFASRSLGDVVLIVVVFFAATAAWCVAATVIARATWIREVLDRFSHLLVPVVYLALGISILVFSGTLAWLAGGD